MPSYYEEQYVIQILDDSVFKTTQLQKLHSYFSEF